MLQHVMPDPPAEHDTFDAGLPVVQTSPQPRPDDFGSQIVCSLKCRVGMVGTMVLVSVMSMRLVPRTPRKTSAIAEVRQP